MPHVAEMLLRQAQCAEKALDYDKAIKHYEIALAILEVANGATKPELLRLIIRLLDLHEKDKNLHGMIPLLQRAQTIAQECATEHLREGVSLEHRLHQRRN